MKIMKYIILLILAVVQPASLSAELLYPDVDLQTQEFNTWCDFKDEVAGHDYSSNFGPTPLGKVIKVRIKASATYIPKDVIVTLYFDNTGQYFAYTKPTKPDDSRSECTGSPTLLEPDVYEYTLDTPLYVENDYHMLALHNSEWIQCANNFGSGSGYTTRKIGWPHTPQPGTEMVAIEDTWTAVQYVYETVPDLVVIDPSAVTTLAPGQPFTIYATVKNQGSGSSSSTTLRYYRSIDSTISTGDTELGTVPVSELSTFSPNDTSPQNIRVSAPTTDGTYWVGACVDSVSDESPTDNQCSAGVQIAVAPAIPPFTEVLYPDVDLATEPFSNDTAWGGGGWTIGHDPTSNFGPTPTGTVIKVRIRTTTTIPLLNSTTVRLYSDNTGTALLNSSTTGNAIYLGSDDVYEYTLDTPFDVTSGTQMLAYVAITNLSLYIDVRTGFTERFNSGTQDPININYDWFTFIQYVYDVPPAPAPAPGRRRVIITE